MLSFLTPPPIAKQMALPLDPHLLASTPCSRRSRMVCVLCNRAVLAMEERHPVMHPVCLILTSGGPTTVRVLVWSLPLAVLSGQARISSLIDIGVSLNKLFDRIYTVKKMQQVSRVEAPDSARIPQALYRYHQECRTALSCRRTPRSGEFPRAICISHRRSQRLGSCDTWSFPRYSQGAQS